jgi:3-oxoacyl-[acyl-carrier protein] reductase
MADALPNALVTGASRGIGAAIALDLSKAGYRVFVNYRSDAAGADAIVQRVAAAGGSATAVQADVSVRPEVEAMFAAIERDHGFVRYLVNNAGITRDALLMLMSDRDWDAVIDTSLRGTYHASDQLRGMMHLEGAITNIVAQGIGARPASATTRPPKAA